MSDDIASRNATRYQIARVVSLFIGAWLVISTFVWPHSYMEMMNTWLVGVLCFAFAVAALNFPGARVLNTFLAIWLFLSAFMLPNRSEITPWHNAILAIVLFVTSWVGPSETATPERPYRPA